MGRFQMGSCTDCNREFKYYRLTQKDKNNLWSKNLNENKWRTL